MKNALTRSLFYGLNYMMTMALQLLAAFIALKIWFSFIFLPLDAEFSTFYILVSLLAFTGIFLELSWFSTFYKNIISCSISRKNFYISSGLIKVLYATVTSLIFALSSSIEMVLPIPPTTIFLGSFIIVFAFECLGDFYGIILSRYGKFGFIFYIVSFCAMSFGATVYISFSLIQSAAPPISALSTALFSSTMLLVLFIISAVFLVMNWFLIKTSEIKS